MKSATSLFTLVAIGVLHLGLLSPHDALAAPPEIARFSAMQAGQSITGWTAFKPAPKASDTDYLLVQDGDRTVLKATARASMSGVIHPVRVDIREFPVLRWRWKVAGPVKSADMMTKEGDDYAARVYVMFDYPLDKLSFGTRTKIKIAESVYGQKIPTAALNYVWDNRYPIGTIQFNAYTDRARMIVMESGSARAGQWITETRDLAADFRAAFGDDPPDIVGVALATDTDNTGETAAAWYGDIEFLPRTALELQ